ncbi:MAG: hypothetical protein MI802_24795 [Desulfobacterales bacterium]|nr:hypothetical protein [Desulfobacterales bacterium]
MKVLNLFSSKGGNTQKVAETIDAASNALKHDVTTLSISSSSETVDILAYDFIFIGSGVYACMPPKAMNTFLGDMGKKGMENGSIQPASPRIPGKYAVIYATYGGFHTGINEAIPCVKHIGQVFDHYGFQILDEWYIVGAFLPKKMESFNMTGRLGDITGRPNDADLKEVFQKTVGILNTI